MWPLGPFEVMHTKLRAIQTRASGHTDHWLGQEEFTPLLTERCLGQEALVTML